MMARKNYAATQVVIAKKTRVYERENIAVVYPNQMNFLDIVWMIFWLI